MGISQFSRGLADYNQAQINSIQNAVDDVEVAVDNVKIIVNQLKTTDVANLSVKIDNIEIDNKGYDMRYVNQAISLPPTGAQVKVLEVLGAGVLLSTYTNGFAGQGSTIQRIEIDGVIVFRSRSTKASDSYTGFNYNKDGYEYILPVNKEGEEYTGYRVCPNRIKFNASLRIYCASSYTGGGGDFPHTLICKYGVKV